jgi:cytochrome oxidase assembly protein ShyY1
MWVGVTRAGYTIAQELPILIVIFAVPAILAAVAIWQLAKA